MTCRISISTWALVVVLGVASGAVSRVAGQAASNPHGRLPEGMDCSACHTSAGWYPLRDSLAFDHADVARFPLAGAHAQVTCGGCHLDLRFDGLQATVDDCATCHVDVHQGRMSLPCVSCHNTRSFQNVDGEAVHARTTFPLTGAHRQVTCESCHVDDVGGAYTPLPTDCVFCHRADFEGAQTVDHVANSFPTLCAACHTTLTWNETPGVDHALVARGFALSGAHGRVECSACHAIPGYTLLFPRPADANDCVACHQGEYDAQHGGPGFPTDCVACHTVEAWSPSIFDHDVLFPINSGPHREKWSSCSDCHLGGTVSSFYCLSCHEHAEPAMADKHQDVAGYVWESGSCLSCHPRGTR